MTVFKNYFKLLKSNKVMIIIYVAILLTFTVFSTQSNSPASSFTASKPNIAIINHDQDSEVVDNLKNYVSKYATLTTIEDNEEKIDDALFYRDIYAVIYVYNGYTVDYLNNNEQNLNVKYSDGASSSYAKMLLEKYFKVADIANDNETDITKITTLINNTFDKETNVVVDNTIDVDKLSSTAYYFSFANYSILAVCIYIISTIMYTMNQDKIKKRTYISSTKSSDITKQLYLGNLIFTLIVWLFVIILSFILMKDLMMTVNGLLFIINSFVFCFSALGIGFLVGTIVNNHEVITAMVNIISLGSSFFCGCFVPAEWLPSYIVSISKIFPSYWYIHNNSLISELEVVNFDTLKPLIGNCLIVIFISFILFMAAVIYNKVKARHVLE